jgi:hypothetical protein
MDLKTQLLKKIQQEYSKDSRTTGTDSAIEIADYKSQLKEKWSEKYKNSINCKNPKGFSQRAHCQGKKKKSENKEAMGASSAGAYSGPLFTKMNEEKLKGGLADNKTLKDIAIKHAYDDSKDSTSNEKIMSMYKKLKLQFKEGIKVEMEHTKDKEKAKEIAMDHLFEDPNYYDKLKKVEAKEATTSASSGQYSGPAFGAKSMSPKDWRGRAKTTYPGGSFVQVKKKCKNFPYCNQGDINALNLSKSKKVKRSAKKLSEKYNISEELIIEFFTKEIMKKIKK